MKYTPKFLRIFIPPSSLYKHFWQPLSTIISKIRHFFNPLPPLSVYVLNGRPLTDSPISVTLALKNVTVKTNDIRLKPMHYWSISWKKFDMFTRVLEVSIVKVAWYCIWWKGVTEASVVANLALLHYITPTMPADDWLIMMSMMKCWWGLANLNMVISFISFGTLVKVVSIFG